MIKTPVAIQPAYTIYYEWFEDKIWTHADVHKWTPKIAKEFKEIHGLLRILAGQPFFCLVDNKKLEKFVKQLGYQFLTKAHCIDNVTRSIYRYG